MKSKIQKKLIYMRIISYACIWTFFPIVAIGETIGELKVKAQEGDTEAQFKLGEYFNTGDGVGITPAS